MQRRGREVGRHMEGGTGEREGPRTRRKIAQATGIGPRPVGAGGGVAAQQWRAAGRG
jgi:hypothetical protein